MNVSQKCLYFLRRFRKFGMSATTLTNFSRCTMESIPFGCITAWFLPGSTAALLLITRLSRGGRRQRSVSSAAISQPCRVSTTRCLRKAENQAGRQTPRPWTWTHCCLLVGITGASRHRLQDRLSPSGFSTSNTNPIDHCTFTTLIILR